MNQRQGTSVEPGRERASRQRDKVSVELEVPFHDVDSLSVVWHGHYYKYLEIARSALLRTRGLDNGELQFKGYRLYVAESKCRYTYPLRYRDRFRVDAWFLDIEQRVEIAYEIYNLSAGRRSARGRTNLVCVDTDERLLHQIPEQLLVMLKGEPR